MHSPSFRIRISSFFFFLLLFTIGFVPVHAQEKESITIPNVNEHQAYEAVYQAFRELELPFPMLNKAQHKGLTGFKNYKHLVFEYRFKYGIAWAEGNLTIFITEKQMKGESGWTENLLPMSEKQVDRQLGPVEKRLKELLADHPYEEVAKTEPKAEDPELNSGKQEVTEDPADAKSSGVGDAITVSGPDMIQMEGFQEGGDPIILMATSSWDGVPIECVSPSEDVIVNLAEEGDEAYEQGRTAFYVWGSKFTETTRVIPLTFYQESGGKRIEMNYPVEVRVPRYYFLPSCEPYHDAGIMDDKIYDECLDTQDACADEIWDRGDIILENDPAMLDLILSEHVLSNSGITDPDTKLNSEKLNFTRKLWREDGSPYPPEEAGELRSFVQKAPCTGEWFAKLDKDRLIALGNQGMEELQPLDQKIDALKKQLTAENYAETEAGIKAIEVQKDSVRAKYERKMHAIAKNRNISWGVTKSDTGRAYGPGEWVTVTGVRWKNGKSPDILLEVPFTHRSWVKTIRYSDDLIRKFQMDPRYVAIRFVDGTDKPLDYGFSDLDKGFKEGLVKTFLQFDKFKKPITSVDFYQSRDRATKME